MEITNTPTNEQITIAKMLRAHVRKVAGYGMGGVPAAVYIQEGDAGPIAVKHNGRRAVNVGRGYIAKYLDVILANVAD